MVSSRAPVGLRDHGQRLLGFGITNDHSRAAVFNKIGQFAGGIGGVQWQEYQAGLHTGGIDCQGLWRFFDLHRHPVTGAQSKIS